MSQKRKFFRLTYELGRGPELVVDGRRYSVLDLSEEGLRFRLPPTARLAKGDHVGGTLEFADGNSCHVRGTVLRTQISDCIVQLSKGVPLSIMMDEQRRLIRAQKGD